MKVLMLNGSPHKHGCTDTALCEMKSVLAAQRIDAEIFWIGTEPVGGCIGCHGCAQSGKCAFDGKVNEFIEKAKTADGFVFGTPVHYAAPSGSVSAFLDRVFYAGSANFKYKPGAAVVSCRRGGASAAFDAMNKYFTISSMPVVSSQYWNMVHGSCADDVRLDGEGMQTVRTLARNMAWMLRCIEAGKNARILPPEAEKPVRTDFIRR